MLIYHYSFLNDELLGSTEAALDPLDQLPLVPAYATKDAPSQVADGHVPVYRNGAWSSEVDNRGSVYWLADGERVEIKEIGVSKPDGALDSEPVIPPTPEDQAKAQKLAGVLFNGVMCSATAEDQWGLSSIENKVKGGMSVNFHFRNGNKLTINSQNWDQLDATWTPFRQSFFQ